MKGRGKAKQDGFTLVELLVVVAIVIVILAASVLPALNYVRRYRLRNTVGNVVGLMTTARMRAVSSYMRVEAYCSNDTSSCLLKSRSSASAYSGANASATGAGGDFALVVRFDAGVELATPASAPTGAGMSGTQFPNTQASLGMVQCNGAVFNSRGYPIYDASATDVAGACLASPTLADGAFKNNYALYFHEKSLDQYMAVVLDSGGRASMWGFTGTTWYKITN